MKRSRFDIPPSEMASFRATSLQRTIDAKRKRCEAEATKERKQTEQQANEQQTTLWIGDLERWEDELNLVSVLNLVLPPSSQLTSIKIARDFQTRYHLGYGFIDFDCNRSATEAFEILNRTCRPGHNRMFKVRWAATNTHKGLGRNSGTAPSNPSNSSASNDRVDNTFGFTLHIGGLDRQISENEINGLLQMFGYVSVKYVRISRTDDGDSRGFGFIKFASPLEFHDALQRLHGVVIGKRAIQVSVAHRSNEQMIVDPFSFNMEYSNTASQQWNQDWSGGASALEQWQQYLLLLQQQQCSNSYQYIGESKNASQDLLNFPAHAIQQQMTPESAMEGQRRSSANRSYFCSLACCGDCPLGLVESGFPIYYENDLVEGHTSSSSSSTSMLEPLPLSLDVFQVSNIVADQFQYVFS